MRRWCREPPSETQREERDREKLMPAFFIPDLLSARISQKRTNPQCILPPNEFNPGGSSLKEAAERARERE
jgi:hypothetical protein